MKTCKPGKVKRHNNGFTSIELMVVLGILIIAVGIAIPVVFRTCKGQGLRQ
ncbi:MAG: hypothetical protein JRI90_04235 [Deltaproteobacteria bacterium]|nr:hypothetical protein [Deltaproteobacteria bacterium]